MVKIIQVYQFVVEFLREKNIDKYSIQFCSKRKYIWEDVIFDIEFISQCSVAAIVDSVGYYYYHKADSYISTFSSIVPSFKQKYVGCHANEIHNTRR